MGEFPITDFGAVADGKTLNTEAIQKAIDAAAGQGGVVGIPEGTFLSGSIFLKPNVELHLDKGAVLLGSNRIDDYPKRETRIEGHFEPWRMALVNAQGMDKVRIHGEGKIDGNGILFWAQFWQRRKENPKCTNLEVERPRLMFIDRCKDVRIEGLSLTRFRILEPPSLSLQRRRHRGTRYRGTHLRPHPRPQHRWHRCRQLAKRHHPQVPDLGER